MRHLSCGTSSILDLLAAMAIGSGIPIVLTEFVARRELNSIQSEIDGLENKRALEIKAIARRDQMFRELTKRGVHKGEAEAIAWILSERRDSRPLFVSRDEGAVRAARANKVAATDVMGLVVEATVSGVISIEQARGALAVWDDRSQQQCRPADYKGFDRTFAHRKNRPPDYYG